MESYKIIEKSKSSAKHQIITNSSQIYTINVTKNYSTLKIQITDSNSTERGMISLHKELKLKCRRKVFSQLLFKIIYLTFPELHN